MNEDCQRKYEFNSYSKEQILKVIALTSFFYLAITIYLVQSGQIQLEGRFKGSRTPPSPSPSDQWISFYYLSVIKMLAVTGSTVNTQHRAFRINMS